MLMAHTVAGERMERGGEGTGLYPNVEETYDD